MEQEPPKGVLIDMPAPAQEPKVSILTKDELPEGGKEFYDALGSAMTAANQALGPFIGKHPVFGQIVGEINRYLELATMYAERGFMYVRSPLIADQIKRLEEKRKQMGGPDGAKEEDPDPSA